MAVTYNWIHFSDLHFGLDTHGWLWPSFKHKLHEDLRRLSDQVGNWDLVLFTGDLTQAGTTDQFTALNQALEDLWKVLSKDGKSPYLYAVPGNHDLVRPDPTSATAKALAHLWTIDADIKRKFWTDSNCEYRTEIERYFANYLHWLTDCAVPTLPATVKGMLPGDFSAVQTKDGCRLGIVGVNSTFLQIGAGDFKGKLDLHVAQLNALCGGDVQNWTTANTANILLTHQPPSWLSADAKIHFKQEIYPPGRFFAQYCGHQHESEAFETSEMGGLPRRGRQAPALFGLEMIGGTEKKRIHGYTAGQYIFDENKALEKMWPRTAQWSRSGELRLRPDNSYDLIEDSFIVTTFEISQSDSNDVGNQSGTSPDELDEGQIPQADTSLIILEDQAKQASPKERLAGCARLKVKAMPQHCVIRKEEQSQLELELRRKRRAWIVADWGVGKEGFLGACFERLKSPLGEIEIFHLQCSEAEDIESLESQFTQQFALALQAFSNHTSALSSAYLLLDDIHPNLCQGTLLQRLQSIIQAMLDYSPSLRVLIVSRSRPEHADVGVVELKPMEVPDVRLYLENHPDASPDLCEEDAVYRIHERSDGLPRHIDRIIDELKVSTLDHVLEAEWTRKPAETVSQEPVPRALISDVASLSRSEDQRTRRSYLLLKVLSLLPYGETIQALRHYLPAEPFFLENALELTHVRLLDIFPLKSILPTANSKQTADQDIPKLLKVPRQVRDYVCTLISDEERKQIIVAGADNYFGPRWRTGKIKLRTLPFEYQEYLNSGPGNEFAVIHDLIVSARTADSSTDLKRALKLGISFCSSLRSRDRFKDCSIVSGGLLQLFNRVDAEEQWAHLATIHGATLRMTGKNDEALKSLKEAIDLGGDYLENQKRGSIYLGIALAEESLGNDEAAVAAAKEVLEKTKENSGTHLQALAIIYEHTLPEKEATVQLAALRERALDLHLTVLSNNLALTLSNRTTSDVDKDAFLNDILKTSGDIYNHIRAIVIKAERTQVTSRRLSRLDLISLSSAYSYLYAQRLNSLFDRCHS